MQRRRSKDTNRAQSVGCMQREATRTSMLRPSDYVRTVDNGPEMRMLVKTGFNEYKLNSS